MEVEITRVLLAFFVGYFLTVSGSLAQIVTQNNLASPSTLGFDGAAVICIILAQFVISSLSLSVGIEWVSFLIFLIIFGLVILARIPFSKKVELFTNKSIQNLILIGLGFNLFVGAIFSVIQFLFMALNWEFPTGIWFGNLKYATVSILWVFSFVFLGLQVFIFLLSKKLRLLSIGHDFALGLGLNVKQTQTYSIFISLFLTGLVISFFGVFSFLGLIFPHVLRMLPMFKFNMRNELLYGGIFTGLVFSGIDVLCYSFDIYGTELPVGMVSSVAGSMALLLLLTRKQIVKK
jgi:iron complex transport system permease protein